MNIPAASRWEMHIKYPPFMYNPTTTHKGIYIPATISWEMHIKYPS